ncbi:MAG: carbohydrate ABC transporter permease [Bacillota bacterium]
MKRTTKQKLTPYMFVLPNLLVFGIFIIYPAFYGLYISFTEWDIISSPNFVGISNFINIFNNPNFLDTLQRTFIYVGISVPLMFVLALVLAIGLDKKIRGRGAFRAIFYMPAMLSFIIIGVSWKWILGDNFGIVNYILEYFGLQTVSWLTTPTLAFIIVILVTVWARAGYFMVIFLAGLQSISNIYYEAAEIDGASKWQQFIHITLPMLKPTSLVVLVLSTISVFKMFDLIIALTQGGPGRATTFLVQDIYLMAFDRGNLGLASAMSVVLFVILSILTIIQFKVSARGGNAYE